MILIISEIRCVLLECGGKTIWDEIGRTFIIESVYPESFTTGSAGQLKALETIHPIPSGEHGLLLNCG